MDYPSAAQQYISMRAGDPSRLQIPYNAMLEGRGLEIMFPGGLTINGQLFAGPHGEDFKGVLQGWGIRAIYPEYVAPVDPLNPASGMVFDATNPPSFITANFSASSLPVTYSTTQAITAMRNIFTGRMPALNILPQSILDNLVALTNVGWILVPIGTSALGFFQSTPPWLKDDISAAKWNQIKEVFLPISAKFVKGQYADGASDASLAAFNVKFWDGVATTDIAARDFATKITNKGADVLQQQASMFWSNLKPETKAVVIGGGALLAYMIVIRPMLRR